MPSLQNFYYSSFMMEVTRHQDKRIRRAKAADLARIVDQELYWSPEALRLILKRIERLNQEEPQEAKACAREAIRLLPRIRGLSIDLKALTFAVYGSSLRSCGELREALKVYHRALELEGLSTPGRADVLARMAVTLAGLGSTDKSLAAINDALPALADPIPALAVRAVILADCGRLAEALRDSVEILEQSKDRPRSDYSFLSAITISCFALSFETRFGNVAPTLKRMEEAISDYEGRFPSGGIGFYKARRPRSLLPRAKALIFMRTERNEEAVKLLQKAVRGLTKEYPADALAATLDLACAYAACDRTSSAALAIKQAPDLLNRSRFRFGPITQRALQSAAQKSSLTYGEAIEIRSMLRPLDGTGE